MVRAETSKDLVHQSKFTAAQETVQEMAENPDKFPVSVFQDPPHKNGEVCLGDGHKRMTTGDLPAAVKEYAQNVMNAVFGDSFTVAQSNAINQKEMDPGVQPHLQAEHADFSSLHSGERSRKLDGVDEPNLLQLINPKVSPFVCIQNFEKAKTMRIVVWPGSHLILAEAHLFYARHYSTLFALWREQPDNEGKGEDAFEPVWTACCDEHLARIFPQFAADPIQPKALTLFPGDIVVMLALTQHAGTSDAGLRLFFSAMAKMWHLLKNGLRPDLFVFAKGRADPSQTSVVAAGATVRLLVTPEVAANSAFPEVVIRRVLGDYLVGGRRNQAVAVEQHWSALENGVTDGHYQLTDRIVPIVSRNSPVATPKLAVIAVVCSRPSGAAAGGEGTSSMIAFVGRSGWKGDHNNAVLRGAAMSLVLSEACRRQLPLPRVLPHSLVFRSDHSKGSVVFRSVVEMHGMPLRQYYEEHLASACSLMNLTEELRWCMQDIWSMLEDLHEVQFRFGAFSIDLLAYDMANRRVQVVQAGFGALFPKSEFKGNTNPGLGNRQSTEALAEAGAKRAEVSPEVDRRRMERLQEMNAEAGEDPNAGSDVDTILGGVQAANLTEAHVRRCWTSWRSTKNPLGRLAYPDMSLTANSDPSKTGTQLDASALDASALAASDCEQVSLALLSWFLKLHPTDPYVRGKWKKRVTDVVEKPVKEAEAEMEKLLKQGKDAPFQPAAHSRLAKHFVHALHEETRDAFNAAPSSSAFCALALFSPERELELSSPSGVCRKIQVDPVKDDGWWAKATDCLRRAGFKDDHVNQLRETPREACLINVPGKGVGVRFSGKWGKGDLAGWYVGVHRRNGRGRYSLALQNGGGGHCDGEPCWSLLLEWVVEHGQFGALLNGSTSVSDCNMEVLKKFAFPHRVNDVELVWVPIRVTSDFSDAEGIWQYNHAAEAGRNRLVE